MTRREHFFSVLEGANPGHMPFVPDITDWYVANRTPKGQARKHAPGAYIADSDPIHSCRGTIPEKYKDFTLLDFYREFNWGFHAHIYDWCDVEYHGGVEYEQKVQGSERIRCFHTPRGMLVHKDSLAADGTWCPREHYVKDLKDLEIMRMIVESARYIPRYDYIKSIIDDVGEIGQVDLNINRSPFGKLVHTYMGFEKVVYAMIDALDVINDFLVLQREKDLEIIKLAAAGPQRLVIISDHADENLISPNYYEQYCIPFYQEAGKIFHNAGKFVSTHLDGNFKGFFPILGKTGFDLLDGCTPAPMFNYEVEELAEAMPERMYAFCGVPSTLFCRQLPTEQIIAFGDRIIDALKGRAILNVGDILPPDGDIEQVIALGKHVKAQYPEG